MFFYYVVLIYLFNYIVVKKYLKKVTEMRGNEKSKKGKIIVGKE